MHLLSTWQMLATQSFKINLTIIWSYYVVIKKETERMCNKMNDNLKRDYIETTLERFKNDPKKKWRGVKSAKRGGHSIGAFRPYPFVSKIFVQPVSKC